VLEEDVTGTKKRWAKIILLRRRQLRLADTAQTDTPQRRSSPANPSSAMKDGEQTLDLGRRLPTLYTTAWRFPDPSLSPTPHRPPERREDGEIAAGNALRLAFALDNCSKGKARERLDRLHVMCL
jgi:hypothetical protein